MSPLERVFISDEFSRTQLFVARAYGNRILPILVGAFEPGKSPVDSLSTAWTSGTIRISGATWTS